MESKGVDGSQNPGKDRQGKRPLEGGWFPERRVVCACLKTTDMVTYTSPQSDRGILFLTMHAGWKPTPGASHSQNVLYPGELVLSSL